MIAKILFRLAALIMLFPLISDPIKAQVTYPNKPIKIIVPFPAAGALDSVARAMADPLSESLKQAIILDNRPGAGSRLGTELVANSLGDGYTVLIATPQSITMAPLLVSNLPYNPEKDLLPVMRVAEIVNVMVVPTNRGINSVSQFLTWAKNKNGPIKYGSSGIGAADHLFAESFKQATKLDLVHVPYKGGGPAMIDLASGDIDVSFTTFAATSAVLASGKIKAIAVLTKQRQPFLPGIPAISETIPGLSISNWAGIFLPKNTPRPVRERLFSEFTKVSKISEVRSRENKAGLEVSLSNSIEEFEDDLKEESQRWSKIIKEANIKEE